jgi:hypothetical protein
MRSVAARYLVASFAFMAAAAWLGVSLTGGFTCLLVFLVAFQAVRLQQRRSDSLNRRASSARANRARPTRERHGLAAAQTVPSRSAFRNERSQPLGRVYDGDREDIGWSSASEAALS